VLGAISEFEKTMLVAKLRGARERKRRTGVKVEGRKSVAEKRPEIVAMAKKLARKRPKGGKRSLREIGAELAMAGFTTKSGKSFEATAVKRMRSQQSAWARQFLPVFRAASNPLSGPFHVRPAQNCRPARPSTSRKAIFNGHHHPRCEARRQAQQI
jgi:hypothetical protein